MRIIITFVILVLLGISRSLIEKKIIKFVKEKGHKPEWGFPFKEYKIAFKLIKGENNIQKQSRLLKLFYFFVILTILIPLIILIAFFSGFFSP